MDGERFDTIAKGLATGSSRRRVIGGVLGSAVALLAGGTTLAAKGKKGKKAKSRKAKVRAQSENQGKGQVKVTLCHWDEDANVFEKITVGGPADDGDHGHDGHEADKPFGNCCNDFGSGGDAACGENLPFCNAQGNCVECLGDGDCTDTVACNSVGACNAVGKCEYTAAAADIGSACKDDTGVCVLAEDDEGNPLESAKCVISNDGTESCIGADPCGTVNPPRTCGDPEGPGDCGCYSTVEGAGLCLSRGVENAGVRCDTIGNRPPCSTSSECEPGWVCAPLNYLGDPLYADLKICCPGRGDNAGEIGFCVNLQADLCSAA
jgi:hypothetical protein